MREYGTKEFECRIMILSFLFQLNFHQQTKILKESLET